MKEFTDEEIEILRIGSSEHFWLWCNYYDHIFFQKRLFLKQCAIVIQDLFDGKIRKAGFSLPPRSGKSYLTTLAAVYFLGRLPTGSVMRNCTTSTLYQKFSYDAREIIRSEKFKNAFPSVELSIDKTSLTGWNLKQAKQVSYFGAGTGGTIIGFGASVLSITDDLYKGHEDALSETINEKTHRWFDSAHTSRIEKNCPELDIGTRWTKNDVIGMRIDRGDYDKYIHIPALTENNESFCDDVKSTEEYLSIKAVTDQFIWNSEYMQEPIEAQGLVFPYSELNYYETKNEGPGYRIAFIDTADEGDDYLSMPIIEYYAESGKAFLVDVLFNQNNLTSNEPLIIAKAEEMKLDQIIIETNKEGTYFINSLRRLISTPLYGQFNSTNKITRIMSQSGFIKAYFYFKKDTELGSEYQKFMHQLTSFLRTGKSKHDDAPDSLSGLCRFLRSRVIS